MHVHCIEYDNDVRSYLQFITRLMFCRQELTMKYVV